MGLSFSPIKQIVPLLRHPETKMVQTSIALPLQKRNIYDKR